jgi:hypothetical protein
MRPTIARLILYRILSFFREPIWYTYQARIPTPTTATMLSPLVGACRTMKLADILT